MCRKFLICSLAIFFAIPAMHALAVELTPLETLGRDLFFDDNLSNPTGQSCAACHDPVTGWTGPDSDINKWPAVYPGAVHTRFGNRKPPTAAYGGDSPVMYYDEFEELFIGGMFWDGRATGWILGDPLAEQAQGPFLNPLEQNLPNARLVCLRVSLSSYAGLFEEVWGPGSLDCINDIAGTYERIARSIAAYERSPEVSAFTSRFDAFWFDAESAGHVVADIEESNWMDYLGHGLDNDELWGLAVFNDERAMCSACHLLESEFGGPPVFTDFTYDNLGVPKNPVNPFYSMSRKWNPDGESWIDCGLGGFLEGTAWSDLAPENYGKHKVPTLRNVDLRPYPGFVKAFGHNGYFKSLEEIVHFYNTRDVPGEGWPPPEVAENVNTDELGNLGLSPGDEAAIVLFMKTLSDGFIQ